jgi:branched-chain amino acid transport system substrate-binding protein
MTRRGVLGGLLVLGVAVSLSALGWAADRGPVRIGLPVPLTGGFAQLGADMRNGLMMAVEEAGGQVAGRKLEVLVEDDGGVPAQTLTKARKLVESDRVHVVAGVFLAPSCWAVAPYLNTKKIPNFPLCGNDDLTQRKPQEYLVRFSWNGTQPSHPFGEYAATTLGYKRVATLGMDYNFAWEAIGAFQRTFEENGGRIVQKIWVPLNAQDFGPYLSQLKRDVDAVYMFFAGVLSLRALKQFDEFGLKGKIPVLGAGSLTDETVLPSMGNEALGIVTAYHYSAALDTPANKRFQQTYRQRYGKIASNFSADLYTIGSAILEAIKAVDGDVENSPRFLAAAKKVRLPEAPRGPVDLDEMANPINNIYIRKVERVGGELQNAVIYTYPRVSQFWKYNKEEYLRQPLYDRDNPPCRFCE